MLTRRLAWIAGSCLALALVGCGADPNTDDSPDDGETAGDGDGDPGDGDGAPGDGDGSPGDGDGAPGDGDGAPNEGLTYWKDAKSVIDARCGTCHLAGGIAPFALESWTQVGQFVPLIESAVDDRSMPPWPPNQSCNTYEHDRSLTDDERELLLAWIADGAPEGDPADAPPDPEPPAPFEADFTLQLPEPYTPTGMPDDYRCFVIPWPEDLSEPVYVTSQLALPDQVQLVHHVITFVADPDEADFYIGLDDAEAGPGYECFGGPGKLDWSARWLGAWVPGMTQLDSPPGTGVRVEPGSSLIVQVHYNTIAAELVADQTALSFQIADAVEREGVFVPIVNYGWIAGWNEMTIPAGEADVHHGVSLARSHDLLTYLLAPLGVGPGETVDIWRAALHMHLLGTHASLSVTQDTQDEDCLLQIDDWDFHWQGDYGLTQAVAFGPGDTINLDCWYDNSADNQPIVDGQPKQPETVGWGDGTFDEMCLGVVYVARGFF